MSETSKIFVHAGLPKTGSTYLQREVFPLLEGVHYIPKRAYHDRREIMAGSDAEVFLLSHESILKESVEYVVEHEGTLGLRPNPMLEEFTRTHPDARFLLVFRRHDRFIGSKYRYYLRKNGHLAFDDYFDLHGDRGLLSRTYLEYMRDVRRVEACTGQPPLVMLQEEIAHAPEEAARVIAAWLGAEVNRSEVRDRKVNVAFGDGQLQVVRGWNRRVRYRQICSPSGVLRVRQACFQLMLHIVARLARLVPPSWLRDVEPVLPPSRAEEIRAHYDADWQELLGVIRRERELLVEL